MREDDHILTELCHQRISFTAQLAGSRAIRPQQYSLLFKEVVYQGEIICDKIWAEMAGAIPEGLMPKEQELHFNDTVSFSAIVVKNVHKKNQSVRFTLGEIEGIKTIKSAKHIFDYRAGDALHQKAEMIEYCSKKYPMQESTPYLEFCSELKDLQPQIVTFQYVGYQEDRLEFDVLTDTKKTGKRGYYRPYVDKERLFVGQNYAFQLQIQNEYFNLQNTFVREKYL